MATYSAVVSLKRVFSTSLHYFDAALPPQHLEIIEFAHKGLKSFQNFVERLDTGSKRRMSASLERVTEEILNFSVFTADSGYDEFDEFVEKIHPLIEKLKKMEEDYYKYSMLEDEEEAISVSSSKMIGLWDERIELKEVLVDSFVKPSFFLIHGMAGIGKTTLAREVFEDSDILEWFECCAWVRVGLEWKSEELTEAILSQLNPDAHKMVKGGDEEEVYQRLNETLIGNGASSCWMMYGIVESSTITGTNSQQRFTTKIKVGSWLGVFEKRLMNKEESWDLLREKAFAGGLCPPQLEDAGKKIAEKCDGLPLTIITFADLLSEAEESIWIDVAARKKHRLFMDAYDQISEVLYPSYKELRGELKSCFLYMGAFPLKYKITRTKLINLWTVEGIFDPIMKQNEIYCRHDLETMKYLDFRSLLMVYQRSGTYFNDPPIQAISSCGLHSSWWHFCQREARKTNFFYVLDCPEVGLEDGIKGQSRLSIHNNILFARKDVYNSMEENCASTAESLLCFGPYHQYQVPICCGLKLLQRLDALNIRFYEFPLEILELVELRYLALTCNGRLPPSISKLGRLQYLTVRPHFSIKSRGALSYLPMEIWDLEELKHLQVLGSNLQNFGDNSLECFQHF